MTSTTSTIPSTSSSTHLVIRVHTDGAYARQRDIRANRKSTIDYLANGAHSGIVSIIEFDPVQRLARDVTEDVADKVMMRWMDAGDLSESQIRFVDALLGPSVADYFRREQANQRLDRLVDNFHVCCTSTPH